MPLPTLETDRLILNAFTLEDVAQVKAMAGDIRVYEMTATIPHPYTEEMGKEWIEGHRDELEKENNYVFAIRTKSEKRLVGCINLGLNLKHNNGVFGYWIGHEFWGQGFCTEALREIIRFGFEEHNLNKVHAHHMRKNPASGRVMEKAGMKQEGILREHFFRNESYEDMVFWGILKPEFETNK